MKDMDVLAKSFSKISLPWSETMMVSHDDSYSKTACKCSSSSWNTYGIESMIPSAYSYLMSKIYRVMKFKEHREVPW